MRNYWRYLGYIWRYKVRVIGSIVASFLSESLNLASLTAYLAAHEVLLSLYLSGGKDAGAVASHSLFKTAFGRHVIDYLRTRIVSRTTLMWTIIAMGFGMLSLTLLRGIFIFLRRYLLEAAVQRGWMDLLNDLFHRVSGLSMRFFSQRSLGHTMATFGPDLGELGMGGRAIFAHASRDVISFVLGLGACFYISLRLSLFVFVGLPIVLGILKVVGDRIRRYTTKGLEKRADAMKILAETIQGIAVIKAYDAEQYQRERLRETSRRMLRYDLRRVLAKALADPTTEFVFRLCFFAVGAYGIYLIIQQHFPPSMLGVFFYDLKLVYDPLEKLRDVNNEIQASRAAADRVFTVMDIPIEIGERPGAKPLAPHKAEVRFDHVSFAYDPPDEVLHDVTFTICAGEVLAIIGENGSGKSTLANLLMRFYDPTGGAIRIDGTDIREVTQASLRRQIGYASQNIILFNDTIRRNIAFGDTHYSDEQIEAAARSALAHDMIVNGLPQGYDTVVGEGGAKLSGGQRQRIALARALLRDPRILVLDEATSAMDVEAEHRLQAQLASFAAGRTVLIIAHRFSTIRFAHRIVAMADGRVEAIGTHEELLGRSPTYRNLFAKQSMTDVGGEGEGERGGSA